MSDVSVSEAIARHFVDSGLAPAGMTFWSSTPAVTAPLVVTVYDTGTGQFLNPETRHSETSLMVRILAENYSAGAALAHKLKFLLVGPEVTAFTIHTISFVGVWVVSDVQAAGRDDRDRHVITFNVRAMWQGLDYNRLIEALRQASLLDEDDWTPGSWRTLADAVAAGELVLSNGAGSQEEIDRAADAIFDAIEALVRKADKTALLAALVRFAGLDEDDWTPSSWQPLPAVAEASQGVYDDPDVDQATVDAATAALNAAIDALVLRADKTALFAALQEAGELDEGDWKPTSWAPLPPAVSAGQLVMDDLDATQVAVDGATAAIRAAIDGLVPIADFSALADAVDRAQGLDEIDWRAEGWADLLVALDRGIDVLSDLDSDQDVVDAAALALLAAIDALLLSGMVGYFPDEVGSGGTADNRRAFFPALSQGDSVKITWPQGDIQWYGPGDRPERDNIEGYPDIPMIISGVYKGWWDETRRVGLESNMRIPFMVVEQLGDLGWPNLDRVFGGKRGIPRTTNFSVGYVKTTEPLTSITGLLSGPGFTNKVDLSGLSSHPIVSISGGFASLTAVIEFVGVSFPMVEKADRAFLDSTALRQFDGYFPVCKDFRDAWKGARAMVNFNCHMPLAETIQGAWSGVAQGRSGTIFNVDDLSKVKNAREAWMWSGMTPEDVSIPPAECSNWYWSFYGNNGLLAAPQWDYSRSTASFRAFYGSSVQVVRGNFGALQSDNLFGSCKDLREVDAIIGPSGAGYARGFNGAFRDCGAIDSFKVVLDPPGIGTGGPDGDDVSTLVDFLKGSEIKAADYDALLQHVDSLNVTDAARVLDAGASKFSPAGEVYRLRLIDAGFTIIDGGPA